MSKTRLSPEQLLERIKSIKIIKAYAKMDMDKRSYISSRSSQGYWQALEEARVHDHRYFENLVIHVDVKYKDRWAKINTTMKERRIKERLLKCVEADYKQTQIGEVRTELHKLVMELIDTGSQYARKHRNRIIKQCESELILGLHQKRYSRTSTYEDALVSIRQNLEKHPEIELSEIEEIWKEIQVKTAMEQ